MRLGVGVGLVAALAAAAFALPSSAGHQEIRLQVSPARIELPRVQGDNETLPVQFTWSPSAPAGQGEVLICWNSPIDVTTLDRCSSRNGGNGATGDETSAQFFANEAGRYEALARWQTWCEENCFPPPPPHWNVSNIVSFEVVDPCRLRLQAFESKGAHTPTLVGAPIGCNIFVLQGELKVAGEDGSAIGITSSASGSITYEDFEFPGYTALRVKAAGARADLSVGLRSRLGQFVTFASTGAAQVIAVSPANVDFVHRGNRTTIRVRSGSVVALGIGQYVVRRPDMVRFCGSKRPTIACLSKIRYRTFTMRRGRSLKARVLRAGQSATIPTPRGRVKLLR